MHAGTRARLEDLNRRFYEQHATDFDAARDHPWPGWARVVDRSLSERGASELRVLDVGCGNGRFAAFLAEHCNDRLPAGPAARLRYLGVDASQPLLERARARGLPPDAVRFEALDLFEEPTPLPRGPFDLVAVFGVLHHVPGFERRCALLDRLLERIAPGGLLAATCWQFANRDRFERRIVPWESWSTPDDPGVEPRDLEAGDHLLRWGSQRDAALRYCHHASDAEIDALVERVARGPGRAEPIDRFRADGQSGDLNVYVLLRPTSRESA